MKMKCNCNSENNKYSFKNFLPLIIIFIIIVLFTIFRQIYYGLNMSLAMNDAMGSFFIIFGLFKISNWKAFANAYEKYDIIAKRSSLYAYIYPLIELTLGILYLMQVNNKALHAFTLVIMLISSIGVIEALYKKDVIMCACLGLVFKVPMTYVTLFEDLVMAIMAAILLFL